jgi:Zn-dependent peptidase ImmA (M78 family)/transcriptional regulator with XRE-family HTH domain
MALTQKELARRLRAAREALGMTQDDVAHHLGVSRSTVAQIEGGNREVSSLELDQLARFFGRDIRELLAPTFDEDSVLRTLFRVKVGFRLTTKFRSTLIAFRNQARELTELEGVLGLSQIPCRATVYEFPSPQSKWAAINQGERVGDEERLRLGLGRAPVPSVPDVLQAHGIRTTLEVLDDNISGLTLQGGDVGPLVVVNQAHGSLRHRFSFAHEFAHVLLDRSQGGTVSLAENRDDLIEIRANAFAAAFLMPADGVRAFVRRLGKGSGSRDTADVYDDDARPPVKVEGRAAPKSQSLQMYDVMQAAEQFEVSRLAMIYRFKNLRLISQPELDGLLAQERSQSVEDMAGLLGIVEPDESTQEMSAFRRKLITTAWEAYRRSLISRGKLVELGRLIDLRPNELRVLQEVADATDDEDDHTKPARIAT